MKVEVYEIIKPTAGRFHSWVRSNVGIIRKPNNALSNIVKEKLEPKVVEEIIINKPMAESLSKVLFVLDASKKWNRILRRGVVIGILTFVAMLLQASMSDVPEASIAVITAILSMIDKVTRELKS